MKRKAMILVVTAMAVIGVASAANYMYEKSSIKGVGYRNLEIIISTQSGQNGAKLVEKQSGSGNIITSKIEVEAERQLHPTTAGNGLEGYECFYWNGNYNSDYPMDYINFTSEQELEYMPVSYQTGEYNQKWIDKLCVQNYKIGSVMTEMYSHAEHLQKNSEVKTRLYGDNMPSACCTGVLEANLNSNIIGIAHIGWMSRDPAVNIKGRHDECGRSVEDLTGVFSIEKFIQLWGNSTCGQVSVDWLPCA